MTAAAVLDREVYTTPEAARLLGAAPSTLRYWLEGGTQGGVTHQPIIRREATGSRYVTWAEFIEAGWLRAYRQKKVPMHELRRFIELLRDRMDVPYPLAHRQPFVSGRRLVFDAQEEAGLPKEWRLIDDQLLITYPGREFLDRVTWAGDEAVGWRPASEPKSTVVCQPDVRFGRPAVSGVSTATIFEYSEEGASQQEIVEEFGVTMADVRWALAFENARRAA